MKSKLTVVPFTVRAGQTHMVWWRVDCVVDRVALFAPFRWDSIVVERVGMTLVAKDVVQVGSPNQRMSGDMMHVFCDKGVGVSDCVWAEVTNHGAVDADCCLNVMGEVPSV